MFHIGLTIICAVFVVGFIFYSVATEREEKPADNCSQLPPEEGGSGQNAA